MSTFMRSSFGCFVAAICGVQIISIPGISVAQQISQPSSQLQQSAKARSVLVNISENSEPQYITGVIIQKNGDLYSALVNSSIKDTIKPNIITVDGQSHQPLTVIKNPALADFSIVQFRSSQKYPVVTIGSSEPIHRGENIYIGGFTDRQNKVGEFKLHPNRIVANRKGVLLYDGETGGNLLFNQTGELIGLHSSSKWDTTLEDVWPTYGGYPEPTLTSLPILYSFGQAAPDCGGTRRHRTKRQRYHQGIPIEQLNQLTTTLSVKLPPKQNQLLEPQKVALEDSIIEILNRDKSGFDELSVLPLSKLIDLDRQDESLYTFIALHDPSEATDAALANYNKAIELNQNDSLAIFMRLQNPNYQGQSFDYEQLVKLNSQDANVYYLRGKFKEQNKDYAGALADYNQMVKLSPEAAKVYLTRGLFKENKLHDLNGAYTDYLQTAKIHNTVETYYFLSQFEEHTIKNIPEALHTHNIIIGFDEKNVDPYYKRAELQRVKLKDFAGALADYGKIIELSPTGSFGYILRANLETENPQYLSQAAKDYDRAIAINPISEYYLARAEFKANKLKDMAGAMGDYRLAIAGDNLNYQKIAEFKANVLNDLPGALADYNKQVEANPHDPELQYQRSIFKATKLQDRLGAIADLQQASSNCNQDYYGFLCKTIAEQLQKYQK